MFNPRDDRDVTKLKAGLKQSRTEMERSYNNRLKAYREMLGTHSPYANNLKRPINLLELASTIYRQKLVPTNPRAAVSGKNGSVPAYAASSLELALNAVLGQEGVSGEIETAIVEALFSPLGVIKTYIPNESLVNIDGMLVPGGMPRLSAVTYDHWVQDMSASSPNNVAFCGDKYYLDREEAAQFLDPDVIAKIPKDDRDQPSTWESQALREFRYNEDYRDQLELWDIWMPNEGLILTFYGDFGDLPPLRVEEWTGGEQEKDGPYERVFFGPTPGNSLPSPPVSFWMDLHRLENILFNKLAMQAERQKSNDVVSSANPEDGDKLRNAKDGDYLALNQVQGVNKINAGGPNAENFGFAQYVKQVFSYAAGNLDALGGLGAMSGTVGQDELLTEGASDRLRAMQDRVREFLRRLCIKLGRYLWNSTLLQIPIQKQSGGVTINSSWSRSTTPGEFPDYLIDIDPYSLQNRSPGEKLMQLQTFWNQFVMPAAPLLQASGQLPNFESFTKQYARFAGMPELNTLVIYTQGEMLPGAEPSSPPKSSVPSSSRSVKTQQGQETSMINELMNRGSQPATAQ